MAHCSQPHKLRSNVFIHPDDKHLLIGDRKKARNNILLFAERFLNPHAIIRTGAGKR